MLLQDKRIFVLDDDALNLSIISAILKRCGAKVYTDVWGTSFHDQVKYLGQVDLILLDLMLDRTKSSGYDIYDQIRDDPALADIPIILVTAADPDTELPIAKEKGFDGFISKPLDRNRFGEQVAAVLDGERVWPI